MTDPTKMPPMTQPVTMGPNTPNTPPVAPQAQTPAPVAPKTDTVEFNALNFITGAAMAVAQGAANVVPTPTVDVSGFGKQTPGPSELTSTKTDDNLGYIYTTQYGGLVSNTRVYNTAKPFEVKLTWPAGTKSTQDPTTKIVTITLPDGKKLTYDPRTNSLVTFPGNELIAKTPVIDIPNDAKYQGK